MGKSRIIEPVLPNPYVIVDTRTRETLTPCEQLHDAMQRYLRALPSGIISAEHINDTPHRYVKAFDEFFSGCEQDPKEVLTRGFSSDGYDEMIYVANIGFVSFCAHHLVPFVGKVHFAYIPRQKIVGLSKVPRLVEVYAKRPQVQERLTRQIVDTFNEVIKPKGCGVVIEAYHFCMMIRGIKKESAFTKTTALTGIFLKPHVKAEFLSGIKGTGARIWP